MQKQFGNMLVDLEYLEDKLKAQISFEMQLSVLQTDYPAVLVVYF